MAASKQKGNRGEKEICDFFKGVFGGNWGRTFGSGAFIGGRNNFKKQFMNKETIRQLKGDIIPPSFLDKLVIESKNYKDFKFHQLLQDKPNSNLEAWIEQEHQSADPDDFLIIIFKVTRQGTYICVEQNPNYVLNNYAIYNCQYNNKTYIITEMTNFVINNKNLLLKEGSST